MIEQVLRMLGERYEWYNELCQKITDEKMRLTFQGLATAYDSARTMLEYAMDGNAEALAQFDTFRKEN